MRVFLKVQHMSEEKKERHREEQEWLEERITVMTARVNTMKSTEDTVAETRTYTNKWALVQPSGHTKNRHINTAFNLHPKLDIYFLSLLEQVSQAEKIK